MAETTVTCPRCGMTSAHPKDVEQGYCGNCHDWTTDGVRAFGVWDAPVTDDAVWIDVPIELSCMYCQESFQPGDNGCVYPTGFAAHRECSLRSVLGGIGHHVDHARYCRSELGPDAGLGYRLSAQLVWRYHVHGVRFVEADLEALRNRGT